MSRRELEEFQYGFSASLKKRLDSPEAIPVSGWTNTIGSKRADEGKQLTRDALLAEVLNQIEETLGYDL
jgi:hypothetical protein